MKILPIIFGLAVGVVVLTLIGIWFAIAGGAVAFWLAYWLLNKPVKR